MPRHAPAFQGYDLLAPVTDESEEDSIMPLVAARKAIQFKTQAMQAAKQRRQELEALRESAKSRYLQSAETMQPGPRPGPGGGRIASWRNGYELSEGLIPVANKLVDEFGLRASSGYRDPERNRRVNGAPNSDHLAGRAFDAVGSPAQMSAAAARGAQMGLRCSISDKGSGVHLHCS